MEPNHPESRSGGGRAPGRSPLPWACLLALLLPACEDAATGPSTSLVTSETQTALAMETELPGLPGLAARAGLTDELIRPLDAWMTSWSREPEGAAELREEAYEVAVPELVEALGEGSVRLAHGTVGSALASTTAPVLPETLPEPIAHAVSRAAELHASAGDALQAGELEEALLLTLRASDRIREVGPQGVALLLIGRAERALSETPEEEGGESGEAERRARHLVASAKVALRRAEWSRAVHRAYYAVRVLSLPGR